jgi:hypothetical protein
MGDWMTQKFLEYKRGESHSKLVLDIIVSSPKYSFRRIKMVYDTIINQMSNLVFVENFCSACKILNI